MERFYFERPSIERKEEIIEFLNEFIEYNSEINGTGGLDKIFEGYTFEQALERTLKLEDEEFAVSQNRCPGKTRLLIRESDNKIVGSINIRWNLNEPMKRFGGNIGYSIRPAERRKGYNKINLYLGLIEESKLRQKRVMLDCAADNIGSDRTMKALGGILERSEVDPSDNKLTNVYWFDVDECIEKYKNTYERYILL